MNDTRLKTVVSSPISRDERTQIQILSQAKNRLRPSAVSSHTSINIPDELESANVVVTGA